MVSLPKFHEELLKGEVFSFLNDNEIGLGTEFFLSIVNTHLYDSFLLENRTVFTKGIN